MIPAKFEGSAVALSTNCCPSPDGLLMPHPLSKEPIVPDLCHVQGVIVSPSHLPLCGATVHFTMVPPLVHTSRNGASTLVPTVVSAVADVSGAISVKLEPSLYRVIIMSPDFSSQGPFEISVPDAAEANLADLQSLIPPPPAYMDEVRGALAFIRGALEQIGEGGGSGAAYDDTVLKKRLAVIEAALASIPEPPAPTAPYDDTALTARVVVLEDAPVPFWGQITGRPQDYPPSQHFHGIGDVEGLQEALDRIPELPAPYDDAPLAGRVAVLEAKPDPAPYDDTALRGRVTTLEGAPAASWAEVTSKPDAFPPAAHGHSIADVAGLQEALDEPGPAGPPADVKSFATDAEAQAYSAANPNAVVFSRQATA